MKLLLVLGAGASRNLAKGKGQMPLMADWSAALSQALDDAKGGLARACHLTPEMDGRTFEENLGELLQWEKVRGLEERFELLGSDNLRNLRPAIGKARANQVENLALVRWTMPALRPRIAGCFSTWEIRNSWSRPPTTTEPSRPPSKTWESRSPRGSQGRQAEPPFSALSVWSKIGETQSQ